MAVFDVETFIDNLKTKHNIPESDIPAAELRGYGMRQDKFSKRMQEVDAKEKTLQEQQKLYENFEVYLRQLESRWGPREDWSFEQVNFANTSQPGGGAGTPPAGLSEQQIDQRIAAAVAAETKKLRDHYDTEIDRTRRGAAMLAEFLPEARDQWRENYEKYGKFKDVRGEFEKFISPGDPDNGVQPGGGYGMPLQTAWGAFLNPYEIKRQQDSWELTAKEREDAAYRRGRSEGPGSLEPHVDTTMSAGYAADNPVDPKATGPSDAEKRARFNSTFDAVQKSQGIGAGRPAPTPTTTTPPST